MKASPEAIFAQAHRARRGVAAAGGYNDAARKSKLVGDAGADPADRGRSLEQRRRPGRLGAAGFDRLARPRPRGLVEHPGPCGVAHVRAMIADEKET